MPLRVHFLNVGVGDCTIIEFPSGNVAIVDIDNLRALDPDTESELLAAYRESTEFLIAKVLGNDLGGLESAFLQKKIDQLTDPLAYYDLHIGRRPVFRFIVTHPDMDHITGLHRFHEQEGRSILNFWHCGPHDFNLRDTTDLDWSRYDKRDWDTYKKLRRSAESPKSLTKVQGDQGDYWTQDGISIWAPTPELVAEAVRKDEPNIISLVLALSYKGRLIVLGGDATADESWSQIYPLLDLSGVDVLKASHHGRKSGYHGPSVKEMSPWLTITSVGEKAHDATENYRRYSDYTVSLRDVGDIVVEITDDGGLRYTPRVEDHWKPKIT